METLNEIQSAETQTETVDPTRKFNLKFGYQDKENTEIFHREIVISRRPTAADFIKSAEESNGSELQFSLGLAQATISKFGSMPMPCPLTALLSLKQYDREKLTGEYLSFLAQSGESGESLKDGKVRLGKGFERNGKKIVDLEFGKVLDGYEEIEIEQSASTLWQRNLLRMIKEITVPSDLTAAEIESLDVEDFLLLQNTEAEWLDSFRNE